MSNTSSDTSPKAEDSNESLSMKHYYLEVGQHPPIYVCRVCEEGFEAKKKLKQHISTKHKDTVGDGKVEEVVKVDLISDEGFTQEKNPDKSKKFTCKQCDKTFKQKQGVKTHIAQQHKNQGIKRVMGETMNNQDRTSKKPLKDDNEDMFDFDEEAVVPIKDSTHIDPLESTHNLDNFAAIHGNDNTKIFDDTLDLDQLIAGNQLIVENEFNEIGEKSKNDTTIHPDQDHNNEILKAEIISLKLELKKKSITISEKDHELEIIRAQFEDTNKIIYDTKDDLKVKEEALEIANAKINSLDENKTNQETKLNSYRSTLRKLIKEKEVIKNEKSESEKEKELNLVIRDKNKKIKEANENLSKLAKRIAELENDVNMDKNSVEGKLKTANNQVGAKNKEIKKVSDDLKKSEKRVQELLDMVSEKNKKISELENHNTRLKLMKDQASDVIQKESKKNETKEQDVPKEKEKKVKCRYENTGMCRNKNKCPDLHPKKTCQSHSKLGSCPAEAICEHRHPYGICYEWQNNGYCSFGDNCKNRHPIELARTNYNQEQPFLGQGPAGPAGGFIGGGVFHGAGGSSGGQDQAGWPAGSPGLGPQWSPNHLRHPVQRRGRW